MERDGRRQVGRRQEERMTEGDNRTGGKGKWETEEDGTGRDEREHIEGGSTRRAEGNGK